MLGALLVVGCPGGSQPPSAPETKSPPGAPAPAPDVVPAPDPLAAFDALLSRYVDREGLVDYAGWKAKDEAALRGVVAGFARTDPAALEEGARKAYWINVYNAVVLQAMLEHHPVPSILKVERGGRRLDVFKDYLFAGRHALDAIEKQYLLRETRDPRVHAALVCASLGCPPLRAEAYRAERLEAQLDEACRRWLSSKARGVDLKPDGSVAVSQVFEWYARDFGPRTQDHLRWIARYVDEGTRRRLLAGDPHVTFIPWDWSPNAQRPR